MENSSKGKFKMPICPVCHCSMIKMIDEKNEEKFTYKCMACGNVHRCNACKRLLNNLDS
ncbi:hypothetical protein LCGC14_1602460 [marine sediment metagenome]|uniref:TFIIS-type domain-containing protein n=1 Tax=marine sediment metagenome TaxID=412755 RepID=A0A0F9LAT8_9ZZZZ